MKCVNNIGTIICEQRKKKHLTQLELAEKLNVSDRAVSNWENDKNLPDRAIIHNLSLVLDYDFVGLMSEKHVNKKEKVIKYSIVAGIILLFIIVDIIVMCLKSYPIYFVSSPDINLGNSYIVIGKNNSIIHFENFNDKESDVKNIKILYEDRNNEKNIIYNAGINITTNILEKRDIKSLKKYLKKYQNDLYIEITYYHNSQSSVKENYKILLDKS